MSKPSQNLTVTVDANRVDVFDGERKLALAFAFGEGEAEPVRVKPLANPAESSREATVINGKALLGMIELFSAPVLLVATQAPQTAELPRGRVYAVRKVALVRLSSAEPSEKEKAMAAVLLGLLESGGLFFSYDVDITRSLQHDRDANEDLWWSKLWLRGLGPDGAEMAVRCSYGFLGTCAIYTEAGVQCRLTVISRRSRKRAGTRYLTRGADFKGDVANYVETEQIVWNPKQPDGFTSFLIVRGSIPTFWRQNNGIAKPEPEVDGSTFSSRVAFAAHFKRLAERFGSVVAVSLVNQHGSESRLADAFRDHMALDADRCSPPPRLVAFDFHAKTSGSRYEEGLNELRPLIKDDMRNFQVYGPAHGKTQLGVFRVNCVDCLDRTGVVQGMISRTLLNLQLYLVTGDKNVNLVGDGEQSFKSVWADNADAISKQYSGTGALKTDYTRTGKRSAKGMIEDGVKSMMRIYFKNFVDGGRQDALDVLCGYGRARDVPFERQYRVHGVADQAQLVTPGGEKHQVLIELRDELLVVANPQSIIHEYPRRGIVSWEKQNGNVAGARLRLIFRTADEVSAAASPLLLQFSSGGGPLRERFLRSLIDWAQPPVVRAFQQRYRVQMVAVDGGPLRLSEGSWTADVICACRSGEGSAPLSAVPAGFEDRDFVLVHASEQLSLVVKKALAPAVASAEHRWNGTSSALHVTISGVEVCFVYTKLKRASDLSAAVRTLKVGRAAYDISVQFDYLYIGGYVPGMEWPDTDFVMLNNGYHSKTLSSGFFVLRGCAGASQFNPTRETPAPTAGTSAVLVDELLQGRPPPYLPRKVSRTRVYVTQLECEGIRHPPDIDVKTPLRTYVRVESDYAPAFAKTRTTEKSTPSPAWYGERLQLDLVESDDVQLSFCNIYGQVLVSGPILGDAVAGYFALPGRGPGRFEMPLLLAGKQVGRISGCLEVELQDADPQAAALGTRESFSSTRRSTQRSTQAQAKAQVQNLFGRVSNYLSGQVGSDPFARSLGAAGDPGEPAATATGFSGPSTASLRTTGSSRAGQSTADPGVESADDDPSTYKLVDF